MTKIVICIPARLASTRLPNKPLADINGKPMIIHVLERAKEANIGDIIVACAEKEIADNVEKFGGKAILTDPELPSGTDRIYQALKKANYKADYVVNVQGDLPTLDPALINKSVDILKNDEKVDISTLAAIIKNEDERENPNVVKAVISFDNEKNKTGKALYFTRASAPYGNGDLYHHIGLYAYKMQALEKFVNLPPSSLEKREKLEQLRALENNMRIDVAIVDTVPLGVDTQEDLQKAINALK
ncbi:3-deoxy-manno-octulosonate cytidylyltransferase [Rickettsiales bacterium]|nr:3-deoxy-manno-octulosonate cytidylyltransferase [Rickettsiales bacterium]